MSFLKLKTYNLKSNSRGFTILELLVVISIIALLSTIVFVGIQNAKQKGKDVAMMEVMTDAWKLASICMDRGFTLTNPIIVSGGSQICAGAGAPTETYVAVPAGSNWAYNTATSSNATDGSFSFSASYPASGAATKTITCVQVTGCTKSGF